MEEKQLTMRDGHRLFYRLWAIEEPKATVHINHGMAEHSYRYDEFARFLNEHGYAVYAQDHRGHGYTAEEDERGWFSDSEGWSLVVDDAFSIDEKIMQDYPEIPHYLFGHSMGSFITRVSLERHSEDYDAAVICGTGAHQGIIGKAGVQETALISFVTSSLAPLTLRALNNSSLVSSILPSAVTIAVNLPMIAEYVKVDTGIDYMKDFNYTATIDDLIDIYDSVIQSGYLDELTDDQGNLIQNDQLIQTTLSDQFYTTFIDIFESLDKEEMKFFDTMIEAVTLNLAFKASKEQPTEGSQIGLSDAAGFLPPLPEDIDADNNGSPDYIPNTYKDVKWGHEVSLVYSSLIKFITLDPAFLVQFVTQDETGLVIRMDKLLELIADHPAEAEMIFTGKQVAAAPQAETTEEGEETADPYENLGLLDSVFINYGWNEILDLTDKFLGDMGQGSEGGLSFNLDLSEIRNTLLKKDTETDFTGQISRMKSEFHSLFGVINAFVSVPEGKNFFINLKTMPGFYFDPTGQYLGADEGLMDAFTAALRKLDDSVIARTIMPQAFDQLLTGENGILKDLDFDLKFDFSNPDLDIGNSLADIIVTYNQSQDFVTFMMSGISTDLNNPASLSNFVSELASYSDDLKSFLTLFVTNPLLNSEIDGVKNYNFVSIFDFLVKDLFNEEIADRIHSYIVSPDFNASLEVSSFVDVFVDVADTDILSVINSDTLDFSALESINFETLFSHVDNSGIMKIALAGMLDDKILTMDIFKDIDSRISFENVKSWADEGKNLNIIIRSAGEIGDLNNIDVFNSDAQAVGNIIDSIFYGVLFSESTRTSIATLVPLGEGYAGWLYGKVVDMFYFPLFEFNWPSWMPFVGGEHFIFFSPVFNLADAAISCGTIAILLFYSHSFGKSFALFKKDGQAK